MSISILAALHLYGGEEEFEERGERGGEKDKSARNL
jgi:hypothetical protein